jgi:hypothetical protein
MKGILNTRLIIETLAANTDRTYPIGLDWNIAKRQLVICCLVLVLWTVDGVDMGTWEAWEAQINNLSGPKNNFYFLNLPTNWPESELFKHFLFKLRFK